MMMFGAPARHSAAAHWRGHTWRQRCPTRPRQRSLWRCRGEQGGRGPQCCQSPPRELNIVVFKAVPLLQRPCASGPSTPCLIGKFLAPLPPRGRGRRNPRGGGRPPLASPCSNDLYTSRLIKRSRHSPPRRMNTSRLSVRAQVA